MLTRHLMVSAITTFSTLLLCAATSIAQPGEKPPLITITGIGEVRAKPDLARLSFFVTGQATTITEAQAAYDKLQAAVKEKLTQKLANAGAVSTISFDVRSVQSDYGGRAASSPVGYRVSSQVEVVVDLAKMAVGKLPELANAAIEAGATLVPIPVGANSYREYDPRYGPTFASFELKDASKQKLEALRLAVADAGPRAAEVAKAIGAKLGKVQLITVAPDRVFSAGQGQREISSATAALWGDVIVQSTVTINYAVEF